MQIKFMNDNECEAFHQKITQNEKDYNEMIEKYRIYYDLQMKWFKDKSSVTDDTLIAAENAANTAKERWRRTLTALPRQE